MRKIRKVHPTSQQKRSILLGSPGVASFLRHHRSVSKNFFSNPFKFSFSFPLHLRSPRTISLGGAAQGFQDGKGTRGSYAREAATKQSSVTDTSRDFFFTPRNCSFIKQFSYRSILLLIHIYLTRPLHTCPRFDNNQLPRDKPERIRIIERQSTSKSLPSLYHQKRTRPNQIMVPQAIPPLLRKQQIGSFDEIWGSVSNGSGRPTTGTYTGRGPLVFGGLQNICQRPPGAQDAGTTEPPDGLILACGGIRRV